MTARRPALIFIFITLFLDILGIGLIAPILPNLVKAMTGGGDDLASFYFGWLTGLYALMQFLFAPLIGNLSDRFGRRPVILLALFGSGLDYFLLAWRPPSYGSSSAASSPGSAVPATPPPPPTSPT